MSEPSRTWHLRGLAINEIVRAADQFEAWNTLRDRPLDDFGLVVTAEPDESDNPILARTSALMLSWGRDEDAAAVRAAAIEDGLPDTEASDREFAEAHRA